MAYQILKRHKRFRDGNGLQLAGGRRRQTQARHIISCRLLLLHKEPVRKEIILCVAFKIHLHAKRVLLLKTKGDTETVYRWATLSGQLQACMYEDFLYASRNANLPRESCLTAQDENVIKRGWDHLANHGTPCIWAVGSVSPILCVTR